LIFSPQEERKFVGASEVQNLQSEKPFVFFAVWVVYPVVASLVKVGFEQQPVKI